MWHLSAFTHTNGCNTYINIHIYPFQFADWIESHFLTEQTEAIKEISDHVANLTRVGPGLGEYMFDKETLSD